MFGSVHASLGPLSKSTEWDIYGKAIIPDWYHSFTFKDGGIYQAGQYYRFNTDAGTVRDINLYAIWDVSYHVIRGQDQTWLIGEERPLRFAADGEYSLFQGVTVDKKQLNPTVDYESAAGSTIVDLKAEYLRTLGQGRHSLRFDYIDGQTNTVSFYIKKDVPSTGDDARFGLWIVLTVISAGGLVIVHRKRRHRDGS